MSRLKRLIVEIHRRSLWQVLGIYVVAAWVAFQVVQTLTEGLGLPDWFPGFALALLILLLPVVLATAFVQEGVRGLRPEAFPPFVAGPGAGAPAAEAAESEPAEPKVVEARGVHHHIFTWRNAVLGGLLAFALLGLAVSGYMAMRLLGIGPVGTLVAKGVLNPRDRIVLADFENRTSDSLLAMAVTDAFRTDLAQSPVVSIADEEYVARVLVRMQTEPGAPFDYDLAREVAVREGSRAVIAGEVSSAGTAYVLSARLVAAESGRVLWADRQSADEPAAIIPAIDRLSKRLRERIGESLKTIRANEPLETVTTSSLEALQKYSHALRVLDEGDVETGITLLEEAVALDTTFAMAYRKLGIALDRRGRENARMMEAFTKAFEHRDRLTDRERYTTIGSYYSFVADDRERTIAAYRALLDLHPDDRTGLNNLAVAYAAQRNYAQAVELTRRTIELDPFFVLGYTNTAAYQVALGRWEAAESTLAAFARALPDHPWMELYQAPIAYARGDHEAVEAHVLSAREARKESLLIRAATSSLLSWLAALHGRLAEAERHEFDARTADEQRGIPGAALLLEIRRSWLDSFVRNRPGEAVRRLEAALERYPLDEFEPLDRPYLRLAPLYAYSGRPDRAKEFLSAWESEIDPLIQRGIDSRHGARGAIALAEGRFDEAIAGFRAWADRTSPLVGLPALAEAYDRAGQSDSALAVYERFVTTPWMLRLDDDAVALPRAYERLGDLYEQRGDTAKAIYYYAKFAELWQDADPELQPRVEAARWAITVLAPDT
jgi:tetratricopeptide (TPR) repeat protein